jgi:hypothetical protein
VHWLEAANCVDLPANFALALHLLGAKIVVSPHHDKRGEITSGLHLVVAHVGSGGREALRH